MENTNITLLYLHLKVLSHDESDFYNADGATLTYVDSDEEYVTAETSYFASKGFRSNQNET